MIMNVDGASGERGHHSECVQVCVQVCAGVCVRVNKTASLLSV